MKGQVKCRLPVLNTASLVERGFCRLRKISLGVGRRSPSPDILVGLYRLREVTKVSIIGRQVYSASFSAPHVGSEM